MKIERETHVVPIVCTTVRATKLDDISRSMIKLTINQFNLDFGVGIDIECLILIFLLSR